MDKRTLRKPVAILVTSFLIGSAITLAQPAMAAGPTAEGLWQKTEDNKPVVWVLVRERAGVFVGAIARTFPEKGDPAEEFCTKCTDDRRNEPVLGINFIRGMKQAGLDYEDGNILDPRDGKIYKAKMSVSPDGQALTVRGYWGIALLGKNEVWHRLPDTVVSELDQSVRDKYYPEQAMAMKSPAGAKRVAPRSPTAPVAAKPGSPANAQAAAPANAQAAVPAKKPVTPPAANPPQTR